MLEGILDPDPWKRWTAFQAASHPFITGGPLESSSAITRSSSSPRDENQANRLFGLYWEPPPDPTIYRRKLLKVQKMREKQQLARRGLGRVRTQSPGNHDGLSSVLEYCAGGTAPDDPPVQSESNLIGGRQQNVHARHGTSQMSSSMQDYGNQQNVRLGEEASLASGAHPFLNGPQSYSEAGTSGLLPGTLTELDFAYALQRPGVVPMGESVQSSVDMSSGPMPGYGQSSFHHHYQQHHSNQSQMVGSYGSNPVSQPGSQKRRTAAGAVPMTSRSYGEGSVVSAPLEISHHQSQIMYGSNRIVGGAPAADIAVAGNVASPATSTVVGNNPPSGSLSSGVAPGTFPDDGILPNPPALVGAVPNHGFPVYGNAQAYLQQQHAALQQQQLLLQQQQAAIALQQEQLRAYGINQVMLTANGGGTGGVPNGVGMNAQAFAPPNFGAYGTVAAPGMMPSSSVAPPGAFYYMTGVDGTPILVAANSATTAVLGGAGGGQISGNMAGVPSVLPSGMSGVATAPGMHGMQGIMSVGAPGMVQSASPGMLSMPAPSGVAGGDQSMMGAHLYSNNLIHSLPVQHPHQPSH
jgi:type II secretory pathway pseudopilin PulG